MAEPSPFAFLAPSAPPLYMPVQQHGYGFNPPIHNATQSQPNYGHTSDNLDESDSEEEYEFESADQDGVKRESPAESSSPSQQVNLNSPTRSKSGALESVLRGEQELETEDVEMTMTPEERKALRHKQDLDKIRAKFPWFEEGMTVPYSKLVATPLPSNGMGGARTLRLGPEVEVDFVPVYIPENPFRNASDLAGLDLLPRHRRTQVWAAPAIRQLAKRERAREQAKLVREYSALGSAARGSAHISSDDLDGPSRSLPSGNALDRKAIIRMSMVELSNWEDQVAFGPRDENAQPARANKRQKLQGAERYKVANRALEDGAWIDEVQWGALPERGDDGSRGINSDEDVDADDGTSDKEDPEDLTRNMPEQDTQRERAIKFVSKPRFDPHGNPLDYLNLSKDYFYQPPKGMKVKVGQGAGRPEVKDAVPAARMDLPWYKPQLTLADMRTLHRPRLMFPTNSAITFEKLAAPHSKTKKEKAERRLGGKARKLVEVPQNSRELTLGDRSAGILLEYSEQYPLAMSKYGMGAVIINYYRKEKDEEETIPTFKLGHPVVLPRDSAEPYPLTFLEPSNAMQSVENDLFRAPIFPHTASKRDFLVIRQTTAAGSKYLLKPIENLFVVGQTYPNKISVPVPQSREYTQPKKELLLNIIYRAMQRDPDGLGQIRFEQIRRMYPADERSSLLLRVKDVMVPSVKTDRGGTTLMRLRQPGDDAKGTKKTLAPEDLLKAELLTPAYLAAMESADAAIQMFKDTGHADPIWSSRLEADAAVRPEVIGVGSEDLINTLERRLAPWRQHIVYNKLSTTTHTVNGTRSQLVELQGRGDPTGRGDGFSLLVAGTEFAESLVDGEVKVKGKAKEQAEQMRKAYLEKQISIWNRQRWSLVNTSPAMLDQNNANSEDGFSEEDSRDGDHDDDDDDGDTMSYDQQSRSRFGASRMGSVVSRNNGHVKREASQGAGLTPGDEDFGTGQSCYLQITRKNRDGSSSVEYITDERIYTAYIRKKVERDDFTEQNWIPGDGKYDLNTEKLIREQTAIYVQAFKDKKKAEAERKLKPRAPGRKTKHEYRNVTCRICFEKGHTKMQRPQCPKQNGDWPNGERPADWVNPYELAQGSMEQS